MSCTGFSKEGARNPSKNSLLKQSRGRCKGVNINTKTEVREVKGVCALKNARLTFYAVQCKRIKPIC